MKKVANITNKYKENAANPVSVVRRPAVVIPVLVVKASAQSQPDQCIAKTKTNQKGNSGLDADFFL